MNIDAPRLAEEALQAMAAALGGLAPDRQGAARTAAGELTEALVEIQADHAAGEIGDEQAREAVRRTVRRAEDALEDELGVGEDAVRGAVKAGLRVLIDAAMNATGFGWAAGVLQHALGTL